MLKMFSLIASAVPDLTRRIPCRNSLCTEDVNKTSNPTSSFTWSPLISAAWRKVDGVNVFLNKCK